MTGGPGVHQDLAAHTFCPRAAWRSNLTKTLEAVTAHSRSVLVLADVPGEVVAHRHRRHAEVGEVGTTLHSEETRGALHPCLLRLAHEQEGEE